jgi:SAM-dependent methyltransferase
MTTGITLFEGTGTSAEERRDFLETLALSATARLLETKDGALDFPDCSFDAVLCVDAIAQLPDRGAVLAGWARIVKPGGRILYTDPAIVAGLVTTDELAMRSSMGLLVISPQGENESLIDSAGLRLLRADDATETLARAAGQKRSLRIDGERQLVAEEGRDRYDSIQRFLAVTHRLAAERRLVRIAFLCGKAP